MIEVVKGAESVGFGALERSAENGLSVYPEVDGEDEKRSVLAHSFTECEVCLWNGLRRCS